MNDLQQQLQQMPQPHREACLRNALRTWMPPAIATEVKRSFLGATAPDTPRAAEIVREHLGTTTPADPPATPRPANGNRRQRKQGPPIRNPHRDCPQEPSMEDREAAWGTETDGWEFETMKQWKICKPSVTSELDALLLTWIENLDANKPNEPLAHKYGDGTMFTVTFDTMVKNSVVCGTMKYGNKHTYNVRRKALEAARPARRSRINEHLESASTMRLAEIATWTAKEHRLRPDLRARLTRTISKSQRVNADAKNVAIIDIYTPVFIVVPIWS